MKQFTLNDFKGLPFRDYHIDNVCYFCGKTPNNVGNSLCNIHTTILQRLSRKVENDHFNKKIKELNLDLSQIDDIEFDGLNHSDSPDYCDAFIAAASQNGIDLTDDQLDFINDSCRDFVYEKLQDYLY